MSGKQTLHAVYEKDKSGWWVASVPEVPGCYTQGRSLRQARNRVADVLSLFDVDVDSTEIQHEVLLPKAIAQQIATVQELREEAAAAQEKARDVTARVARDLTEQDLSLRDAAELLGVSHQRLHQQVHEPETRSDVKEGGAIALLESTPPPSAEWIDRLQQAVFGKVAEGQSVPVSVELRLDQEMPEIVVQAKQPVHLKELMGELSPVVRGHLLAFLSSPAYQRRSAEQALAEHRKSKSWFQVLRDIQWDRKAVIKSLMESAISVKSGS